MRILLTTLVAASLAAAPAFAATANCARAVDHTALDVTALKTQLMVVALTCQHQDKYDAFVRKFQPDLQAQDKSLNAYFSRAGGRASAKQRDDYVTNLANVQSQTGLRQGSLFCDRTVGVFDEVMALKTGELAEYAAAKAVAAQPINVSDCGAAAAPTRTASNTRRKS